MDIPVTIKDAAAGLRSGAFTSVELTKALLDKAHALNPTLGAFITFTDETAMAAAAAADAVLAGVDQFVAGSAVYNERETPQEALAALRRSLAAD